MPVEMFPTHRSFGVTMRSRVRIIFIAVALGFGSGDFAAQAVEPTWHRCRVRIPAEWKTPEITIDLGEGRARARVLINGAAGSSTAPALRPGTENAIAIGSAENDLRVNRLFAQVSVDLTHH